MFHILSFQLPQKEQDTNLLETRAYRTRDRKQPRFYDNYSMGSNCFLLLLLLINDLLTRQVAFRTCIKQPKQVLNKILSKKSTDRGAHFENDFVAIKFDCK